MKARVRQEIIDNDESIFVRVIIPEMNLAPQVIELPDELLHAEFEAFTPDAWDDESCQDEFKVVLVSSKDPSCIYMAASCDLDLIG